MDKIVKYIKTIDLLWYIFGVISYIFSLLWFCFIFVFIFSCAFATMSQDSAPIIGNYLNYYSLNSSEGFFVSKNLIIVEMYEEYDRNNLIVFFNIQSGASLYNGEVKQKNGDTIKLPKTNMISYTAKSVFSQEIEKYYVKVVDKINKKEMIEYYIEYK